MTDLEYEKGKSHGRNGRENHHFEMFIHRTKYNEHCLTEEEETFASKVIVLGSLSIIAVIGVIVVLIGALL